MNEKEELLSEAKSLIADFHSLPVYQRYKLLRKEAESDKRLVNLKKESKTLKDSARFLSAEEKKKTLKKAKELYDEYENDPLISNLNAARKELEDLVGVLSLESFSEEGE